MSSDNIAQEPVTPPVSEPQPSEVPVAQVAAPTQPAQTPPPQAPAPQPSPPQPAQPPEFFNLADALRMIAKYYERDFPKLSFSIPAQIIDGCVIDFVDGAMGITIASARLRVRNRIIVSNETGDMFLQTQLSDLAFSKSSVPVTLK